MNKTIKVIIGILGLLALGLLAIDFLFLEHKAHFEQEEKPGFYGAYSFIAFVVLVVGAKYILRPIVFRKEDFYD